MWLGSYCISCIFQKTLQKNSYTILAYDDDNTDSPPVTHYVKNIEDEDTSVEAILKTANTKIRRKLVNYDIQFLSCSSELSNSDGKMIMKKHNFAPRLFPVHDDAGERTWLRLVRFCVIN